MNWIPDQLEAGAEYVRGYRWARYVEPLEAGRCDAVGFLGAHSRAGSPDGVLCHTVNADGWHAVRVNGREVGESEILAAIAGTYGVPAICIAGDDAACTELRGAVGQGLVVAPVKWGLGRYAARILAPSDARQLIECAFRTAVANRSAWPAPRVVQPPVRVEVDLASPDRVLPYAAYAGVELTGPRTVEATGGNFWDAWSRLWQAG
jgi:D-amino peptidase